MVQEGRPGLPVSRRRITRHQPHPHLSFVGFDTSAAAVPYLAAWADSASPDTFERIAALVVDRLARRLENALGADSDASDETAADVVT
ncbi:MAG: hypothetical protein QOI98_3263 [Solirubrobacteraceae bacterium]|nr:hypothetical protein [Solirubrobacteraceae bacterium]